MTPNPVPDAEDLQQIASGLVDLQRGLSARQNEGALPEAELTDLSWVPPSCLLMLSFENGRWHGSLRLRNDYLGYLVHDQLGMSNGTPEATINDVRVAFERGPGEGDVAQQSYFRQARESL